MSSDNIVVSVNVIQTVTNDTANIIAYDTILYEPIISSAQGPQGIQGISSANELALMTDVSMDNLTDGSLLVYDGAQEVWIVTKNLSKQTLECGQY